MDGVLSYALRAQEAAEAAHMPDYVAAAKGNQAWLAWRRRDLPAAEQRGQEALALWRQSPLVYPFQWQALWPLIAVALARGREDEAWAHAQALLEPTQQRLPDELNAALEAAVQAKRRTRPAQRASTWIAPWSWPGSWATCSQILNLASVSPQNRPSQTPHQTLCKRCSCYHPCRLSLAMLGVIPDKSPPSQKEDTRDEASESMVGCTHRDRAHDWDGTRRGAGSGRETGAQRVRLARPDP